MSKSLKAPRMGSERRRRWPVIVLISVAVVLAAALGYYIGQQTEPAPTAGRSPAKSTSAKKAPSKAAAPAAQASRPTKRLQKRGWITKVGPEPNPKSNVDPQTTAAEVVAALDNPDPKVREEALLRLLDVDHPAVNTALSKAISDSDEDVRETAMDVMSFIESPNILASVAQALSYGDEDMREEALEITEGISDPRTVDILIENGLLNDNAQIVEGAFENLEDITEQEFKSYQEARQWWDQNRETFQFDD